MDCMSFLHSVDGGQFDLTLTDIPYGEVNRSSNGLRNLDKEDADILTFNLQDFLKEIYNEGDIVFDPCCGSGAHCLVAKEENRNYIGVELKNQYYEIAKERLQ